MSNSFEAIAYLKKLHSIVRYIDISDANMQEGSFRCDVNISIRPVGDTKLYTRCEIKNMNSFKFIDKAIKYEVARQIAAWEDGTYNDEIVQETRLFDVGTGETRSMRGKEDAADYRYFPDPDLLPLIISGDMIKAHKDIPELPAQKVERYTKLYGIKRDDALQIVSDKNIANYFESMMANKADAKLSVSWLCVELLARFEDGMDILSSPISADRLCELVHAISCGDISGKAGKQVFDYLMTNDNTVAQTIEKLGLKQLSDDGAILKIIDDVLSSNTDKVAQYKSGKDKLFGFFVGQVMKQSRGTANPQVANKLLKAKLDS
jgi:aspartyl-tRNA(Asn)/glutamyl-tRNA(Gln) amidotransferase subunit B